jgi:hypothetical protein
LNWHLTFLQPLQLSLPAALLQVLCNNAFLLARCNANSTRLGQHLFHHAGSVTAGYIQA